jgi:hypothetical protein
MRKEKKKVVKPSFFQFFVFLFCFFRSARGGRRELIGRGLSYTYCHRKSNGWAFGGNILDRGVGSGFHLFYLFTDWNFQETERERERNVSGVSM